MSCFHRISFSLYAPKIVFHFSFTQFATKGKLKEKHRQIWCIETLQGNDITLDLITTEAHHMTSVQILFMTETGLATGRSIHAVIKAQYCMLYNYWRHDFTKPLSNNKRSHYFKVEDDCAELQDERSVSFASACWRDAQLWWCLVMSYLGFICGFNNRMHFVQFHLKCKRNAVSFSLFTIG